jgi:GNAT superfamily N-acetyltransferase
MQPLTIIREATPADAAPISAVIRAALWGNNAADYPPGIIEEIAPSFAPDRLVDLMAQRRTWVAESAGAIVGTASLQGDGVRTVFVLPAAQAGGIGIGLMRQVETFARGRQIASLTVPSSITAVNFYRKLGYVVLREQYWRNVRTILMRKEL